MVTYMRFIVELPDTKVEALRSLLDSHRYKDVQSFILTAIDNQLYIEQQPLGNAVQSDFPLEQTVAPTFDSSLTRLTPESSEVTTVKEPKQEVLCVETLWALYNRLFPVKTVLRVLLNIVSSSSPKDGFVDLAEVQDAATQEAVLLFKVLSRIDKKNGRKPGEKLTAGLPKSRDRAKDRFRLYFVGSINSKNRLEGAPAILSFVNIRSDESGKAQIGLTESGVRFAELENPILDRQDYSSALSAEEASFYMQHIAKKLEKEYRLCNVVLETIANGRNTPDELTQVVLDLNPDTEKEEAQAIRSSLVSRLSELGLLTRKRKGLNVTYVLTPRGHELTPARKELVGNET
jgi:predicted transcriptional regulator